MAKIIVSFASETEAQQAINRLTKANVGEVRARNLDQPGQVISPELGSIEVRPGEIPQTPEAESGGEGRNASATIPRTGGESTSGAAVGGVQVELEVDDEKEEKVLKILGLWGGHTPSGSRG